jgi:hypothetical protein
LYALVNVFGIMSFRKFLFVEHFINYVK